MIFTSAFMVVIMCNSISLLSMMIHTTQPQQQKVSAAVAALSLSSLSDVLMMLQFST